MRGRLSRAGSTHTHGSRNGSANGAGPGAEQVDISIRHQERPEGDVILGPGSFSVPESPNLTLEEVSGTAYAALTPYRCGHSIQPSSLMQLFQYCLCPQTA
jgi:hypothetical protein